jgi:hypothetical protein
MPSDRWQQPTMDGNECLKRLCDITKRNPSLYNIFCASKSSQFFNVKDLDVCSMPLIQRFFNAVSNERLYSDFSPLINQLFDAMNSFEIVEAEDLSEEGTSLKFKFVLEGGINVIFKPKRYNS